MCINASITRKSLKGQCCYFAHAGFRCMNGKANARRPSCCPRELTVKLERLQLHVRMMAQPPHLMPQLGFLRWCCKWCMPVLRVLHVVVYHDPKQIAHLVPDGWKPDAAPPCPKHVELSLCRLWEGQCMVDTNAFDEIQHETAVLPPL